ncbi:hypothetical protein E4T48_00800 [Aureobasidium sp. EXF-10727]|nr:hypothetical protein E4T48_00800 [Aureobasidium sp. EXF-10727]KAI4732128.1 hypothetical protein E4T49_00017 [Aureobasidium sp. EXF-10728]
MAGTRTLVGLGCIVSLAAGVLAWWEDGKIEPTKGPKVLSPTKDAEPVENLDAQRLGQDISLTYIVIGDMKIQDNCFTAIDIWKFREFLIYGKPYLVFAVYALWK